MDRTALIESGKTVLIGFALFGLFVVLTIGLMLFSLWVAPDLVKAVIVFMILIFSIIFVVAWYYFYTEEKKKRAG